VSKPEPVVYVAWSKAAGACDHKHESIGAALACACKFNGRVRHELGKKAKDWKAWQRDVRRLVDGKPVELTDAEQFDQGAAAVDRAFAWLAPALEQAEAESRARQPRPRAAKKPAPKKGAAAAKRPKPRKKKSS
jgi:hypothetical protein